MREIAELHRFNAWANRSLLASLRQLEPDQLNSQLEWTYDPILRVMNHLALVELRYLQMMRREPSQDWTELDLDGVADLLDRTGAGLVEVAATGDLESAFRIPWFEREFTVLQGLGQVLTHSINHRADVNQWLPRLGIDSADVDFVDMVLEEG